MEPRGKENRMSENTRGLPPAPPSMPPLMSMPPTAEESRQIAERARPLSAFVDRRCRYGSCGHKGGVYRMIGGCLNCRTERLLGLFTAGHEAIGGNCPVCGCAKLHWDRLASPDEIPADFEPAPAGAS